MNAILFNIKDFYFYYHTMSEIRSENPDEIIIKTSLCTRVDFISAAFDGLTFLVYNVALAALSALAVIVTAGLKRSFRASFSKNAYEGIVHAGSIFVSIVGIISPQTINQEFLKLNVNEQRLAVAPDTIDSLVDMASLLGPLFMRQRLPIK